MKVNKRTYKGKVTSTNMDRAVVVTVGMPKKHRIYGKTLTITKKFHARDEIGVAVGDTVTIEESRPIGGKVAWQVTSREEEASK